MSSSMNFLLAGSTDPREGINSSVILLSWQSVLAHIYMYIVRTS